MKIYYQDDLITLIHGDNREWLRSLTVEDRFELCLTDPPYDGANVNYGDQPESLSWLRLWISDSFPLVQKHCKRILLTPGIKAVHKYPQPNWIMAYVNPGARGTGKSPWGFNAWTPVLVYGKDPYLENGMGSRPDASIVSMARPLGLKHPTPKSINAWRWLLERGSVKQTDHILDPFSGSGTTMVICKQSGRRCTAIELSEEYCEESVRRVELVEPLWSNSAQGDNNGNRTNPSSEHSGSGSGPSEAREGVHQQQSEINKQLTLNEISKITEEINSEAAEEWIGQARSIGPLGR